MITFRGFHKTESGNESIYLNNEIIFGHWVFGYYVCLNENVHRIYTGYAENDVNELYPECYDVIPETVGQGVLIEDKCFYEGDIIEVNRGDYKWLIKLKDIKNIPREMYGSSVVERKQIGTIYQKEE